MITHNLKIDTKFFDDVKSGKKNFEIRKNDRNFGLGDTLVLHAYAFDKNSVGSYQKYATLPPSKPLFNIGQEWEDDSVTAYFPVPYEETADTITTKVTGIWNINNMFNENGYVNDIENAIDLDLYEKILNNYFERDTLPNGYVVMGIKVIE